MLERLVPQTQLDGCNDKAIRQIILCERDAKLLSELNDKFSVVGAKNHNVKIIKHQCDFLDLPETSWVSSMPITVVSNLPYSAATAILNKLARYPDKIAAMILMFQAEVAKRLRAPAGTKAHGSLSVWTQNTWEVTKIIQVTPKNFSPPPEVDSEVVLLTPLATAHVNISNNEKASMLWECLLKGCFAHKRKMLRSALAGNKNFQIALDLSHVDGTKRAEALEWDEWDKLFEAFMAVSAN
ncbi:MAG: rRNA adenine dimethyltransferase family protein, partial [Candidatus Poribacteria bacterium]